MDVTTSITPLDQTVEEAASERPGLPIRVRLQPAVFRKPDEQRPGNFQAWRNLHWVLTVKDLAEARQFREALSAFFFLSEQRGIAAVHHALVAMIAPEGVSTVK